MINVHFAEAELLLIYINNIRQLPKSSAKRAVKQMGLSTYPDIRVIQKQFRRSIYRWVYLDKPIDYNKLNRLALAVRDKAAQKSAPKS